MSSAKNIFHHAKSYRCFKWKYCAVSENVFLCLPYIYTFPIASFNFYCQLIHLSSKLGLQRSPFWIWLTEWVPNQILKVWYKQVFKRFKDGASSHKTNCIDISLEILNLEVHQNCCIGSKVTAIFLNGWIWNIQTTQLGRWNFFFYNFCLL